MCVLSALSISVDDILSGPGVHEPVPNVTANFMIRCSSRNKGISLDNNFRDISTTKI